VAVIVWLPAGLDGAVAAGGADELPDGPAGGIFDPAANGGGGEQSGEVDFDGVVLLVVARLANV
jgi:hypothetical protein